MSVRFECERITDHILRIKDGGDVCEYLVTGNKAAMLIDTGYGVGDLKGFIGSICDLPLKVYITHCHVDHAGGAYPFEEVHMSHLELPLLERQTSLQFRKQMLSRRKEIEEKDYLPQRTEGFIDIKDQELVDLGDVHVLMVHVPGHTQGSFVPIILEDRAAMFGDASGVGTLINLDGSASVEEYHESLKNLKTYESLYDIILRQHGTCTSSMKLLDENIENCELILAGKDDHIPTLFMGRNCFWARERDENGGRVDGKEGNICYSEYDK